MGNSSTIDRVSRRAARGMEQGSRKRPQMVETITEKGLLIKYSDSLALDVKAQTVLSELIAHRG